MSRQRFYFIGMSDEAEPRFDGEVSAVIAAGRVFSGGLRHHERVRALLPEGARWIDISTPLDRVFEQYEGAEEVVVFASGDPLFFGFANTVKRRLPEAEIVVFPAMNSLQTLAHRFVLPYDDLRIVSLTGRPWHELDRALIEGVRKIGLLTDRVHTPAAIAARLLEYGFTEYRMLVGECLGNRSEERTGAYSLEEAAGREFAAPNCCILCGEARRARFGLPEAEFELLDGRAKMITKMPVRLTTLAMLGLERSSCFWDVGSCTGSVSVEAKLRFPHLRVYAFEIRPEGERLLRINSRRFRAPGIECRVGDFLACDCDALPAPDAVFIGGHGGRLPEMVARIAGVLLPGGAVVFNSVSEESCRIFGEAAVRYGLSIEGRCRVAVDDHNPIEIIKARKTI